MVNIQSPTAEIRRGKKKKERRKKNKPQHKNIMAPLLHRAAINRCVFGPSSKQSTTWPYTAKTMGWGAGKDGVGSMVENSSPTQVRQLPCKFGSQMR